MTNDSQPSRVTVVEVGPRDGLQNERVRLTTDQKLRMIGALADAGLKEIEVGSFVHPKWIPQMADTAEVIRRLPEREGVRYWALVPNQRGLDNSQAAGATHIAVFLSSSESHNQKNLNRSIDESLETITEVVRQARDAGQTVRGYISTVFGCPYEGQVDFGRVMEITDALLEMGVWQVSLGDTTGMGTPPQVEAALHRALERFDVDKLALHLHDTRGLGVANAMVALRAGFTTFDASVGGMGGCPYAAGASGNLGTEDLIYMLHSYGVETGVELPNLLEVSRKLEFDNGATLNSAFYRYFRSGNMTGGVE
ncbi:MAG: hydroxymethylglutaryl-CoA lyase [Bradymonadia bacterium]|jgi:hydroxymethylglutaryl-CoA lyase